MLFAGFVVTTSLAGEPAATGIPTEIEIVSNGPITSEQIERVLAELEQSTEVAVAVKTASRRKITGRQ